MTSKATLQEENGLEAAAAAATSYGKLEKDFHLEIHR